MDRRLKTTDDILHQIRNGCVFAANIASIIKANREHKSPSVRSVMLDTIDLLTPERGDGRVVGSSTYSNIVYATTGQSRYGNKEKPQGEPILIKTDKGYFVTETGIELLKLQIEELRRIAEALENTIK